VKDVRDDAVHILNLTMTGKMKHPEDQAMFAALQHFSASQIQTLEQYILNAIDGATFRFLRLIEEKDTLDLIAYTSEDKKEFVSLKAISDLLFSELYTDEGWIAKYSAYPPSIK